MPPPRAIDSILKAVGRTPLVRLTRLEREDGPRLYAKCEYLNPGGSIFDRAAAAQLSEATLGGHLPEGGLLVASGGGDAIISLAMVASATGHPFVAVVPRGMLPERKRALVDYGARLVAVDDDAGVDGARLKAIEVARERKGLAFCLHDGRTVVGAYEAIGREIIEALDRVPTLTFSGLDLGAIPTGIARGLGGPLVAVEPDVARIASASTFAPHLMLGLCPGPQPTALDRSLVTDFEAVSEREAWNTADRLGRETGLLAGLASGAIVTAMLRRSSRFGPDDALVTVLPDLGERRFMLADFFK